MITDDDNNPANDDYDGGYVVFKTYKLGTFGLFMINPQERDHGNDDENGDCNNPIIVEEETEPSIYPNPFRGGTNADPQVVIQDLPDDVNAIDIFTISGEKIATLDSQYIEYSGSSAVWKIKNNSGVRASSGIYIASIKTRSGKTKRIKIAIIW